MGDSEWKEEKRGKIVDDAIIVEHESEPSIGSENGGPKKLILPFNRMAVRKRQIVSVDENGQTSTGTAETGGDYADLFRPLNEKRQIVARPDYGGLTYPGTVPETPTGIKFIPGKEILELGQDLTAFEKRQIVSVDNDGQAFEGTAETETSDLFRPLPQKRQIVSVDNDGETSQGTPETGNSDNSHLFRPLKEKRYTSMMELTRLPAHKKRSGN